MNKKCLVKFIGGMVLSTGLLATHVNSEVENVNAQINYNYYNKYACEEFGLSDDYINAFERKFNNGYYSNNLADINLANTNTKEILENQILALLAINLQTGVGFNEWGAYKEIEVGTVSNEITIHYTGLHYEIVGGGNTVISNLILNFVKGIGCETTNSLVHTKVGKLSKMRQPRFTVKGDNIDLYIPYVYYNKETRTYFSDQLASRLEVLTGKKYNVNIRTSTKTLAKRFQQKNVNLNVNTTTGLALYFSPLLVEGYKSQQQYYDLDLRIVNGLPTKNNPNPSTLEIEGLDLAQYLWVRGEAIYDYLGVNGSVGEFQRVAFAELLYYQFMYPYQMRIEFNDFTVTLRDNYTLEIKPTYVYN